MKIFLAHSEIQEALTQYVSNRGFDTNGQDVTVTLKAGRGAKGYSAEVDIVPEGTGTPKTKKAKAAKVAEPETPAFLTDADEEDKPAIDFS